MSGLCHPTNDYAWPVAIAAGVMTNGGPSTGRNDVANAVWSFYTLSVKEDAAIRSHTTAEGIA